MDSDDISDEDFQRTRLKVGEGAMVTLDQWTPEALKALRVVSQSIIDAVKVFESQDACEDFTMGTICGLAATVVKDALRGDYG